jgi:transcriptional regulator of acetoin/glycerol metabolism
MKPQLEEYVATTVDAMLEAELPLHEARGMVLDALMTAALRRTNGEVKAAARLLRVHRNTVHHRLRAMQGALRGKTSR